MPNDRWLSAADRLIRVYARADAALRGLQASAQSAVGAFLGAALTPAEQCEVSLRLYDVAGTRSPAPSGLWSWEAAWFRRRLPAPPARLLVGGAGEGREVAVLVAAGYTVDACEPVAATAARLAEQGAARAVVATHEALAAAVLDGATNRAAALAGQRYDGLVFGWGSLTHVLEAAERRRALLAADRLCPEGPLLASFWIADAEAARLGRAARIAGRAGAALARARGVEDAETPPAFAPWCGFGHAFRREEVEALAAQTGRITLWESDDPTAYPHVTWVKPPG